jgi:hypothetical protein
MFSTCVRRPFLGRLAGSGKVGRSLPNRCAADDAASSTFELEGLGSGTRRVTRVKLILTIKLGLKWIDEAG